MIKWYDNEKLAIFFATKPIVSIRYILPSHTEAEKKSIKKYPFVNKKVLEVALNDKKNSCFYSFEIPKGYCFDGASVPRFFWRVIGSNTDNKFLVAAMIHDYMCENHSAVNNNRVFSTEVFNALLEVSEVGKVRRFLMKHSVNIFQKWFCSW